MNRYMENKEEVRKLADNVNHPSHYAGQGKIECIDFMEEMVKGYSGIEAVCLGNAIKYLWRYPYKGRPEEDLEKAKWYISHAAEKPGTKVEKGKNLYIIDHGIAEMLEGKEPAEKRILADILEHIFNRTYAKNIILVNYKIEELKTLTIENA